MSTQKLKKELGLFHVYAIATGTTLSAGFFLLPAMAAAQSGPAMALAYFLAIIPLIPAVFSIVELSTAMPKAGGVYYFLDRSLGPLFGTIGGLGTWFAMILKVAFALIGMGYYLALYLPEISESQIVYIAILITLALGVLNLFGSKHSGGLQNIIVIIVVVVLFAFIGSAVPEINRSHFKGFTSAGWEAILSTAGLVYVSYAGITKVTSLSEEIDDPEKNLPRGIFLSLLTVLLIYGFGTLIMTGILPLDQLTSTMTPVADTARILFGQIGVHVITVVAILAFLSVSNAGILSASRYPLAMSRDQLLPSFLKNLTNGGTPLAAIILTVLLIIGSLYFLEPLKIAKLASAFQLLIFAFICLTVIVMRESQINSYDPGFKSPFYPWTQIIGIIVPIWFIFEMGTLPLLFSLGLIVACILWYYYYARPRINRTGAIFHVFERLGHLRYNELDSELRGILKVKGLRAKDPFDEIIARCLLLDFHEESKYEAIAQQAAQWLSPRLKQDPKQILTLILEGTRTGSTPVANGVALPHFRSELIEQPELVMVRSKPGIIIKSRNSLNLDEEKEQIAHAIFFLVSPKKDPAQHLRILAQIADHVDSEHFASDWMSARDEQELKEILLRDERCLSLTLKQGTQSGILIGKPLHQLGFCEGCLIALYRRDNEVFVPRGNTVFKEDDRLTIIGDPVNMRKAYQLYSDLSGSGQRSK